MIKFRIGFNDRKLFRENPKLFAIILILILSGFVLLIIGLSNDVSWLSALGGISLVIGLIMRFAWFSKHISKSIKSSFEDFEYFENNKPKHY